MTFARINVYFYTTVIKLGYWFYPSPDSFFSVRCHRIWVMFTTPSRSIYSPRISHEVYACSKFGASYAKRFVAWKIDTRTLRKRGNFEIRFETQYEGKLRAKVKWKVGGERGGEREKKKVKQGSVKNQLW